MSLKIRISTIIIILLINLRIDAQPLVGFQLGLNMANLVGDEQNDDTKTRVGIAPYLSFDFPINNMLIIETGISYSMQGMKRTHIEKTTESLITTKTNYNLDYVVVPVYILENFEDFYAKIGPYGAYAVSPILRWSKSVNTAGVITETKGTDLDFLKNINLFDAGLSIGFGYINYFDGRKRRHRHRRRRSTMVMQVDLKYNFGLVKLGKPGTSSDLNVRNRVFTLGITLNSVLD